MKYIDFQNSFNNRPLIDVREVKNVFPDFESRRFYEWQKKGYITKISKLFYVFADRKINDDTLRFIANKLMEPSYLSLEYALRYYNLIPEAVYSLTSITTRKTRSITAPVGNFRYRALKESLFFGYRIIEGNGAAFKIAEPEKALLDLLYLRSDIRDRDDIEGLRINREAYSSAIDSVKMEKYLEIFRSRVLSRKYSELKRSVI